MENNLLNPKIPRDIVIAQKLDNDTYTFISTDGRISGIKAVETDAGTQWLFEEYTMDANELLSKIINPEDDYEWDSLWELLGESELYDIEIKDPSQIYPRFKELESFPDNTLLIGTVTFPSEDIMGGLDFATETFNTMLNHTIVQADKEIDACIMDDTSPDVYIKQYEQSINFAIND